MSRIGNTPVSLPQGIVVEIQSGRVVVKGPLGTLIIPLPSTIAVKHERDHLEVLQQGEVVGRNIALHGLVRSTLANGVVGVSRGWTKTLELSGVGYRASLVGENLSLTLGFSHPVIIAPPTGVTFKVTDGKILVIGIDKQLIGQVAAQIRDLKKPEPYKGKGIRYQGEYIRKKAGKAAKAIGAISTGTK